MRNYIVSINYKILNSNQDIKELIYIFKAKNDKDLITKVRSFIEEEYTNEDIKVISFEYNTIKHCAKTERKNVLLFTGAVEHLNLK